VTAGLFFTRTIMPPDFRNQFPGNTGSAEARVIKVGGIRRLPIAFHRQLAPLPRMWRLLLVACAALLVDAQPAHAKTNRVDVFILAGQSNMKGRGHVPDSQPDFERIFNMRLPDGRIEKARHPLHAVWRGDQIGEKDNSGVGPGLAFAEALVREEAGLTILLVPCASGGSWADQWLPSGQLYERAIDRAREALRSAPGLDRGKTARIAGVLWLQGESDAEEGRYAGYASKLDRIVRSFRRDLGEPRLPFVAATIGSFIKPRHGRFDHVEDINGALLSLPERVPDTACVDARDLDGHIGDFLHYNTASQQIIGKRLARSYLGIRQAMQDKVAETAPAQVPASP